jgi:hypothetical protein
MNPHHPLIHLYRFLRRAFWAAVMVLGVAGLVADIYLLLHLPIGIEIEELGWGEGLVAGFFSMVLCGLSYAIREDLRQRGE